MGTLQIEEEKFEEFRQYLENLGFSFEDRPYQIFLARKSGLVVNLYDSGKIVFGGKNEKLKEDVTDFINSMGAIEVEKPKKEYKGPDLSGKTRIGTDEVGKGDYFGPLVIAGVLIDNEIEKKLEDLRIKDSKKLSDVTISDTAFEIKKLLDWKQCEVIWISPLKYNILHKKLKNLNKILGWGHARAIENLLRNGLGCKIAIADQFGDPSHIKTSLMKKGKTIELVQAHRAEEDIAVATASILARETFITKVKEMSENYGVEFPKGASQVMDKAKEFIDIYGIGALQNVAKIHFSTTAKVTGGIIPEITESVRDRADLEAVPRKLNEKERKDALLECFNLISSFEIELRRFIEKEMFKFYGKGWWEKKVDKDIRGKCEKIAKVESKHGRKVELIDCLQFPHYQYIITDKKNWEKIFSKIFKDKEQFLSRIRVLRDVRDAVSHSRGDFGAKEKLDCITSITHLRKMMNRQLDLDTFVDDKKTK